MRNPAGHYSTLSISILASAAYALSIGLHEAAHAITGLITGGAPALVSSTDVRGDFSGVSDAGYAAIGASGSLVNLLAAAVGYVLLQPSAHRTDGVRVFGWVLFAISGFIPFVYLVFSPLLGFGDWTSVFNRLDAPLPFRLAASGAGVLLSFVWFRLSSRILAGMIGENAHASRKGIAQKIAVTSWLAGTAVALAAAILSPLDFAWALLIATGSTMGTTWLLLPAADRAASMTHIESNKPIQDAAISIPMLLLSLAVIAGFIFVLGPGIRFNP